MSFQTKQFQKAKFEDRTDSVPVPDLAEWFDDGDDAVFVVKALTAEELARCNEAASKNENMSSMIEALNSSNNRDKIDAMREMLGVTESVPNDLAKRLEHFHHGTVDPDMDHEMAVKFAENFPVEFYSITNKIMELTGQGRQLVKKKNYSETPQSEQPSPSVTSEEDSSLK